MSESANLIEVQTLDTSIDRFRRPLLAYVPARIRGELVRKSLHMLVALLPSIAAASGVEVALGLLSLGTIVYAVSEFLRLNGYRVAVITSVTIVASRDRGEHGFVLGPVTLAVGAMLALLLYPSTAAALAIYALAFGDGVASLVGRAYGRVRHIAGKTVEGSIACFAAVWVVAYVATEDVGLAMSIAAVATVLEALPTGDMDNIILPVGVGLAATTLLPI